MKSAVFLYNTQSGKCKIGHCTASICTVFRAYGYEIVPQPIDFEANPFDGNEQIDLMVVAGGDGTVNYVVNAMRNKGLDIPLGVIPAGTANDFAGALGMSHKPLEAAKQIASGAIDRVDCGCVNGLYFVNIFSFGIFTTTSQRTPDERKHKIGKLAYMVAIGSAVSISIGNGNRVEKMQMPYVMAATVDVLMTDGEKWIPCRKDEYGEIEPLANTCGAVFGAVYATRENAVKNLNELVESYQKGERNYLK